MERDTLYFCDVKQKINYKRIKVILNLVIFFVFVFFPAKIFATSVCGTPLPTEAIFYKEIGFDSDDCLKLSIGEYGNLSEGTFNNEIQAIELGSDVWVRIYEGGGFGGAPLEECYCVSGESYCFPDTSGYVPTEGRLLKTNYRDLHYIIGGGDCAGNISSFKIVTKELIPEGALIINNGDESTTNLNATLTFSVLGAVEIATSTSQNFSGISFVPYVTTMNIVLDPVEGEKTIYAQFKNQRGELLTTVDGVLFASDSIVLNSIETPGYEYHTKAFSLPDASSLNKVTDADVPTFVGRIIKYLLGFLGTIALCMFIYAGILWMTAGGGSEKQGKALKIMLWTSLGIALMFSSYAVINFVFEAFM